MIRPAMPCLECLSLSNHIPSGMENTGVLLIKIAVRPTPAQSNDAIAVISPTPYSRPPMKTFLAYLRSTGNGRMFELNMHAKIKTQFGITPDIAAPVIGSVSVNP